MNVSFVNDCAVDGCYRKNVGGGKQMCREHQDAYERGEKLRAFYGRVVQKAPDNAEKTQASSVPNQGRELLDRLMAAKNAEIDTANAALRNRDERGNLVHWGRAQGFMMAIKHVQNAFGL